MNESEATERVETLVIGGGQAGLTVGYHLQKRGIPFLIVDANERIGDAWRRRWDSLRLFTPNYLNGLPGLPFPGDRHSVASKDEMADYLETYARHFDLTARQRVEVKRLSRTANGLFVAAAGGEIFEANNVVVAMSSFQRPRVPSFSSDLDPGIVQIHSADYRNPSQVGEGGVLIVGAGNSGAEIAMELATDHKVWLAGPDTGHIPYRVESKLARPLNHLILRFVFHHLLTTTTPMGRKARAGTLDIGGPLIRVKPKDLTQAGVERMTRISGVEEGLPQADDGTLIDAKNVIWCTGFHPGFSWIDLPVFVDGHLEHARGVVPNQPGLYFVGLHFLHALSSGQIQGVGRDAEHVVREIATRRNDQVGDRPSPDRQGAVTEVR